MREPDAMQLLTSFEAAQILGCAPDTIRLMARLGRLPIEIETRAGRLFRRDVIENIARQRREEANKSDAAALGAVQV